MFNLELCLIWHDWCSILNIQFEMIDGQKFNIQFEMSDVQFEISGVWNDWCSIWNELCGFWIYSFDFSLKIIWIYIDCRYLALYIYIHIYQTQNILKRQRIYFKEYICLINILMILIQFEISDVQFELINVQFEVSVVWNDWCLIWNHSCPIWNH